MNKSVAAIAVSLLAGTAAIAIVLMADQPQLDAPSAVGPGDYFDQFAATEDRIRALELAVAQERNARQLLEEDLQVLYGELDRLDGIAEQASEEQAAATDPQRDSIRSRVERFRDANSTEGRTESLINAGFSPDRAAWIVNREAELQMEAMQVAFEARQAGETINRGDVRLDPDRALRAEIGDTEYELYLESDGRSTSVAVGTVIESSPGQRAGLQAGDEIVSYGGKRVFSYWELSEQTMTSAPGQSVVMDIIRDGVPMQVVIESGPIGISANRGRRGR